MSAREELGYGQPAEPVKPLASTGAPATFRSLAEHCAELAGYAAENAALPFAFGHIVSPRYLPPGHPNLAVWRKYCKETPKENWPAWLRNDVAQMKQAKA